MQYCNITFIAFLEHVVNLFQVFPLSVLRMVFNLNILVNWWGKSLLQQIFFSPTTANTVKLWGKT